MTTNSKTNMTIKEAHTRAHTYTDRISKCDTVRNNDHRKHAQRRKICTAASRRVIQLRTAAEEKQNTGEIQSKI